MEARKKMMECANSMGLVPSWVSRHGATVPSWVRNIFSWAFHGSKIFSRGYFVGPKFVFMGISWVRHFFSWVFSVGPKFYLVGILWVQHFSRGFEIFSCGIRGRRK